MTIVHDPSLEVESSKPEVGGGTVPFMAPELLVPSKFGLDNSTPTKEADIYAMAMTIYQVLTVQFPARAHIYSHLVGPHWNAAVR